MAQLGLPPGWGAAPPGSDTPAPGFNKRIATADMGSPAMVCARDLHAAVERLKYQRIVAASRDDFEATLAALRAAKALPDTAQRQRQRAKAQERAREQIAAMPGYLPDDEILKLMRMALRKLAGAVVCLVDDFSAFDYELGMELARWALGEFGARVELREELAAAEA